MLRLVDVAVAADGLRRFDATVVTGLLKAGVSNLPRRPVLDSGFRCPTVDLALEQFFGVEVISLAVTVSRPAAYGVGGTPSTMLAKGPHWTEDRDVWRPLDLCNPRREDPL